MIKHVVLFQLNPEVPEIARQEIANTFKSRIEELPQQIPCIQHIEVGLNVNPEELWDICLVSEFDTMEDLHSYAVHPAHCKVASMIRPYVKGRSCVDYAF